jgi:uncharacterized protein YcbX
MPTLARISVTPLKSTALQHPDRVRLGPDGVAENRRFFLVDGRACLLGAPRHPVLFRIAATYDAEREHLAIRLADGSVAEGPAVAAGEQITVDFWGRPTPGRLMEGDWNAALSACIGEPVRLVRAERDGGGIDDRPVTLVSSASVRELARRARRDDVDARRFRILFEIDGVAAHEEDGWGGRLLHVGGAVVRVGDPIPRCAVTQRDPDTGAADLETLKIIDGYRGRSAARTLDFGVYGDVVEPGTVAVGDQVTLLEG